MVGDSMTHQPPLPEDYELPAEVNDWHHDTETGKNGHVWFSTDGQASVGVFATLDEVHAKICDERAYGFERTVEVYREPDREATDRDNLPERVAHGVDRAVEWMQSTAPSEWSHPDVCEAVFDAPPGYELARYYMETRYTTVYYRRDDVEKRVRLAGAGEPEEFTVDTCPYLYIHVWNGSGSATIGLAPWLRAHGPGSKHWEIEPVVEPPEDCGLEIAVTIAREWAAEQLDRDLPNLTGQSSLARWSV